MAASSKELQLRELKDTISELNALIKSLQETISSMNAREAALQTERDNLKEQVDYSQLPEKLTLVTNNRLQTPMTKLLR